MESERGRCHAGCWSLSGPNPPPAFQASPSPPRSQRPRRPDDTAGTPWLRGLFCTAVANRAAGAGRAGPESLGPRPAGPPSPQSQLNPQPPFSPPQSPHPQTYTCLQGKLAGAGLWRQDLSDPERGILAKPSGVLGRSNWAQ